jgi:hypothetical protein
MRLGLAASRCEAGIGEAGTSTGACRFVFAGVRLWRERDDLSKQKRVAFGDLKAFQGCAARRAVPVAGLSLRDGAAPPATMVRPRGGERQGRGRVPPVETGGNDPCAEAAKRDRGARSTGQSHRSPKRTSMARGESPLATSKRSKDALRGDGEAMTPSSSVGAEKSVGIVVDGLVEVGGVSVRSGTAELEGRAAAAA